MNRLRYALAATLACTLLCAAADAQRRTTTRAPAATAKKTAATKKPATAAKTATTQKTTTAVKTAARTTKRPASARRPAPVTAASRPAPAPRPSAADARMTGVYLLDTNASPDPAEIARRVAASLPPDERREVFEDLSARLVSPPQIAIQRRGHAFDIASTRAPRITFDADGQTYTESAADGHSVRTRAVVYGDSLMVSSRGSSDDEFSVNFDAVEQGRFLRVTRRIYEPRLTRPVVVQSVYERTSPVARFSVYGEPVPASVADQARNDPRREQAEEQRREQTAEAQTRRESERAPQPEPARRQQQPPAIRRQEPPRPYDTGFSIGERTRFVGTLDRDLDTERTREGDPFTLNVSEPAAFAGATIEGRVARIDRGGPFSGRTGITLAFERIRLTDGRTADFTAYVEEVRLAGGEDVRVDNEGGDVQSTKSQTNRTAERAAIGAAIGALIGAVADGGKGAAIGAAVGAGAGLGSVYVQGRDDLTLPRGTQIAVRTTRR